MNFDKEGGGTMLIDSDKKLEYGNSEMSDKDWSKLFSYMDLKDNYKTVKISKHLYSELEEIAKDDDIEVEVLITRMLWSYIAKE